MDPLAADELDQKPASETNDNVATAEPIGPPVIALTSRRRGYRLAGAGLAAAAATALVIGGLSLLPNNAHVTVGADGSGKPASPTSTPSQNVALPAVVVPVIPNATSVTTPDGKLNFDLPSGYKLAADPQAGVLTDDPYGAKWIIYNNFNSFTGNIGRAKLNPAKTNPSANAPIVSNPATGCATSAAPQRKAWVIATAPADASLSALNGGPVAVQFVVYQDLNKSSGLGLSVELSGTPRPLGLIPGGCGVPDNFFDSAAKEYVTFTGMPYSFAQKTTDPLAGKKINTLAEAKEFTKTPEFDQMMKVFQSVKSTG
ncbi:hypothetical protein [Psychromicrobium lacuslunae]|nr:hypothetical protein [Psychromicrobium lacuslunae]